MKKLLSIIILLVLVQGIYSQEQETQVNRADQVKAQALYSEGVALLKSNDYAEAEAKFSEALELWEIKEALKMSHIYRGMARSNQKKYGGAIEDFNMAIQIDPNDPKSYIDRGKTYLYARDAANAMEDFEKAVELDPGGQSAEAGYYWMGRIAFSNGDFEKCIAYLDTLLDLRTLPYNQD